MRIQGSWFKESQDGSSNDKVNVGPPELRAPRHRPVGTARAAPTVDQEVVPRGWVTWSKSFGSQCLGPHLQVGGLSPSLRKRY